MFYKLSNTANLKEIEDEFKVTFEFPKLYAPKAVINGLVESILPVVTMEAKANVNFAIWGLLPESLEENWDVFQKLTNTLNINTESLDSEDCLYAEALETRRCLIITTGFFTYALHNGKVYPYHVYLENHKPFSIAGVYNRLDDGFLTCSILIKKTRKELGEIPNLLAYKPVIFDKEDRECWLDSDCAFESIKELVSSHQTVRYQSHPISKEFYDNHLMYDSIANSESFNEFLKIS